MTIFLFCGIACIGVLGIAIYFGTPSPMFSLPGPSGPFKVGTQVRHVVDADRRDPYSGDANGPRELMIQIWYPADRDARGPVAPYRDRRGTTGRDARLAQVSTHSIVDAPVSRSRPQYPLLLYSPAWDGVRTDNTFHAEELASHGYIVVGMDHPYGSEVTVFPDGRIIRTRLVLGNPFASEAALESFIKTVEHEVRIRADDAKSVLDALERLNANDPGGTLTGRLDLDRVGIFGFSLGGAVAAQACWLDRRFKAGLDMDGLIAAEAMRDGPGAPFFFLLSEEPPELAASGSTDTPERRQMEFDRRQLARMQELAKSNGSQIFLLDGLSHFNFSDSHFYTPWSSTDRSLTARFLNRVRFWSSSGRAERAARMVNEHVLDFFDKHLKAPD